MKQKKEVGLTRKESELNRMLTEIVEQLRIQNRIQSIAVEALLDKKIEQEGACHDDPN